eukprot:scpid17684/ scgid2349/ Synaptotagmin-like protein 4; Exophilin-2; Granuphilin
MDDSDLDLSDFSLEEIVQIQGVLKRDAALQKEVDAKRRHCQQEIHKMRLISATGTTSRMCARCRQSLGVLIGRGQICPQCNLLVCSDCKKTSGWVPASLGWLCSFCLLQRQSKYQAGDWFFGVSKATPIQDRPSERLMKETVAMRQPHQVHKVVKVDQGAARGDDLQRGSSSTLGGKKKKKRKSRDESHARAVDSRDPSLAHATGAAATKQKARKSRSFEDAQATAKTKPGRGVPDKPRSSTTSALPTLAQEDDDDDDTGTDTSTARSSHDARLITQSLPPDLLHSEPHSRQERRQHRSSSGHAPSTHSSTSAAVLPATAAVGEHVEELDTGSTSDRSAMHYSDEKDLKYEADSELSEQPASTSHDRQCYHSGGAKTEQDINTVAGVRPHIHQADLHDSTDDSSQAENLQYVRRSPSPRQHEQLVQPVVMETEIPTGDFEDTAVLSDMEAKEEDADESEDRTAARYSNEEDDDTARNRGDSRVESQLGFEHTESACPPAAAVTQSPVESKVETDSASDTTAHSASSMLPEAEQMDGLDDIPQRQRVRSNMSDGGSFRGLQRRANIKRKSGHGTSGGRHGSAASVTSQNLDDSVNRNSGVSIESALAAAASRLPQSSEDDTQECNQVEEPAAVVMLTERERARRAALERVRKKRANSANQATAEETANQFHEPAAPSATAAAAAVVVSSGAVQHNNEQGLSQRERARRIAVARVKERRRTSHPPMEYPLTRGAGMEEDAPAPQSEAISSDVPKPAGRPALQHRSSTVIPNFLSSSCAYDPEFDDEEFHGSDCDEDANAKASSVKRRTVGASDSESSGSESEGALNVDDYFTAAKAHGKHSSTAASRVEDMNHEDQPADQEDVANPYGIDAVDKTLNAGSAGHLQFDMRYGKGQLHIRINACNELAESHYAFIYAKIYLLPDLGKAGKRLTAIRQFSTSPNFKQEFTYKVGKDELHYRSLSISLWVKDTRDSTHNIFYGAVKKDFTRVELDSNWSVFEELLTEEPHSGSIRAIGSRRCSGNIDLSVRCKSIDSSELTEAGAVCRLDVLVRECNGISASDPDDLADPFICGMLLPGMKNRVKTRVCKATLQPEWNQQLTFADVTFSELPSLCIELSVWDYDRFTGNDFLGAVRLGLSTDSLQGSAEHDRATWRDSNAGEEKLWTEMLENPGDWVNTVLTLRDLSPHR